MYGIDAESKAEGTLRIELSEEVDQYLQTVTYSLSNVSRQLPFAETLQFLLDIPPHQSLSKWLVIAVSYHGVAHAFGTYIRTAATQPAGLGKWVRAGQNKSTYQGVKKKELAKRGIVLLPAKQESKPVYIYRAPQLPVA